jgi:hypothetical protein
MERTAPTSSTPTRLCLTVRALCGTSRFRTWQNTVSVFSAIAERSRSSVTPERIESRIYASVEPAAMTTADAFIVVSQVRAVLPVAVLGLQGWHA